MNPLDRMEHNRPPEHQVASDTAQLLKPAHMLSDDAEQYRDIAWRLHRWATAMCKEILEMRHRSGFRDRVTMDMQELDSQLYRAATGDNWLPRAREAGL